MRRSTCRPPGASRSRSTASRSRRRSPSAAVRPTGSRSTAPRPRATRRSGWRASWTSCAPKPVSSRAGMERAATSPFYPAWVAGAEADLAEARAAIRARDLDALGLVAEHSALEMHAVGLAARPPLVYWRAATVGCLERVWQLRAEGTPAFATIDAGPQVKVLCAPADAGPVAEALRAVPGVERVLTCAPGGGAEVAA